MEQQETAVMERLDSLASAAGGRLIFGLPETSITGIFTDTREPLRGGLFVALRGERFDGNSFARDAVLKLGAAAVMLDRPDAATAVPSGAGAILVDDSRTGYLGIAAQHRQKYSSTLYFGITGSVGKSTTKELLAHILTRGAGWNVHKAKSSFNNAIGLSHTIMGVDSHHRAAVLELGTNHPGEIRQLASVARPHVALITCAGASHLQAFESVENVAREKAQILAFQSPGDTAVLNADDPYFKYWRNLSKGKVLSFGLSENADVRAKHVRVNGRGCAEFMVRFGDSLSDCVLLYPGLHQAGNALCAIAAAMAAGMRLEAATEAACTFEGLARRFSLKNQRGITIIDDAYNANPNSFASALETLKLFNAQRKFVVAGDMLELGACAAQYHRELGRQMANCGLSGLVTVGELAAESGQSAVAAGLWASRWKSCDTPQTACETLKPILKAGDVVLIKGSHGVRLEQTVAGLLAAE